MTGMHVGQVRTRTVSSVATREGEASLVRLADVARTIRSKNAGPDFITFDIIFDDKVTYETIKNSDALHPKRIGALYDIEPERIVNYVAFDPARAIKFSIRRLRPSGSPGESDVMGSQMYAPLLDVRVPAPTGARS